jgi:type II secretory ATPase GspE/PulE/Tfp pilus assembly ATPase PilB-like protein
MDKKPVATPQPQTLAAQTQSLRDFFSVASPDPIKFLDVVLSESVKLSASDILFEPTRDTLRIRARIDGVMYELGSVSLDVYGQISSRIKVMANLDSTERRRIQEGQFVIDSEGRTINLRVEIAQIIHGELIVIRVHEKATIIMDLASLGFNRTSYENYQNMLKQRSGLILVCGPTGCGKTTTLYSTITKLNENKSYNVMTIEDPIEYQLEGVNQMQVKKDEKFTFSEGLKTILRLSPDIVLVGEIRDKETAEIAVESGLTGQLVLSTLHAEDSVGALFRLLDLGIETYLLNSSLMGIVAQRLVRRACTKCRKAYQPNQIELDLFEKIVGRAPKQLIKGEGCSNCNNLSFKGRTGIFEVLVMNANIRDLIRSKINEDDLRSELIKGGFLTLLRDGLEKAEQGVTTVDEVLRNSLRVV